MRPSSCLLFAKIEACLDSVSEQLNILSLAIWNHPETAYEEKYAHDALTNFLEEKDFAVQKHFHIPTAFRAEFQSRNFDPSKHFSVCFISEYDSLPEIGHACGHNLIAICGVGAALGVQALLRTSEHASNPVEGRVILMGTPAEESTGGKIDLLKADGFHGSDFCLMAHPSGVNITKPAILGLLECELEFVGNTLDPGGGPFPHMHGQDRSSSAADAAVMLYNSLSLLRQKLQPGNQIHGVIYEAGVLQLDRRSVARCHYYLRAPTVPQMEKLKSSFEAAIEGAKTVCDCSVTMRYAVTPFKGLISNQVIASLYDLHAKQLGIDSPPLPPSYGSTDMGNVSNSFPSLHTFYSIGDSSLTLHTADFEKASGTAKAHTATVTVSKVLAMVAVRLLTDHELARASRVEFSLSPASGRQ